jgi:hypothetical protein
VPKQVSFSPTPNGPIAIVHADSRQVADALTGERIRRDASRLLGGMPIVLRCRLGEAILLRGPEHLYRYAGSEVDALPIVKLEPPSA